MDPRKIVAKAEDDGGSAILPDTQNRMCGR